MLDFQFMIEICMFSLRFCYKLYKSYDELNYLKCNLQFSLLVISCEVRGVKFIWDLIKNFITRIQFNLSHSAMLLVMAS